jgi:hypothetical protein
MVDGFAHLLDADIVLKVDGEAFYPEIKLFCGKVGVYLC